MDLFLIPALVALCKRVALRCPTDYSSDAAADELEGLVGAIGAVFQARLPPPPLSLSFSLSLPRPGGGCAEYLRGIFFLDC
jgi:hypothetical protein